MFGKVPWVLLSKLEETNESSFRGHSEFLTFQDKQKYLVWFQEPTLKCGFLEKGQRSQAILSLFWGGSGGRRPGSVPKSQPASVFSTLSCSSIPPLAGTASHAWLVPYHQRNTAEHCCLCLYLVQGQPRRRNRHRWCLYAAFWPVCLWIWPGPLLLCIMVTCPLSPHGPSCLSRARRVLLGAGPALFCSAMARGGTETQEVAERKLHLVCTFSGPDTLRTLGTSTAWGPWESWMQPCFSCQQTFSLCYL